MSEMQQQAPPPLDIIKDHGYTMDELAVNPNCIAIPFSPMIPSDRPLFIRVKYLSDCASATDANSAPDVASLVAGETAIADLPLSDFGMIVGLAPKRHRLLSREVTMQPHDEIRNPYKMYGQDFKGIHSVVTALTLTVLAPEPHTPLVVARQVMWRSGPRIVFYALKTTDYSGLPGGHTIRFEEIFFLPGFRGDFRVTRHDKRQWKDKIERVFGQGRLQRDGDYEHPETDNVSPTTHTALAVSTPSAASTVTLPAIFSAFNQGPQPSVQAHSPPFGFLEPFWQHHTAVADPIAIPQTSNRKNKRLSAAEFDAILKRNARGGEERGASDAGQYDHMKLSTKPCLLKIFVSAVTEEEAKRAKAEWDILVSDTAGTRHEVEISSMELKKINEAVVSAGVAIECRMIRYFVVDYVKHMRRIAKAEEDGTSQHIPSRYDRMEQHGLVRRIVFEYIQRNGL